MKLIEKIDLHLNENDCWTHIGEFNLIQITRNNNIYTVRFSTEMDLNDTLYKSLMGEEISYSQWYSISREQVISLIK